MSEVDFYKIANISKDTIEFGGIKYVYWRLENADEVLGPWVKLDNKSEVTILERKAIVLVCEDQKLPTSIFDGTKVKTKYCWGEMTVKQVRKIYPNSDEAVTPTLTWEATKNTIEEE
jgi:hypothetical protein